MSQLLIQGGRRLDGEVRIQGAKNSVLPILAATLLTGGQVLVQNCPHLRDVEASVQILRTLGCTARWEAGGLLVDTAQVSGCTISDRLMREMRSSAIFLGAILARCGQAEISYPGGCGASWDQTCQKRAECFRALLIVRGLPYRGKHTDLGGRARGSICPASNGMQCLTKPCKAWRATRAAIFAQRSCGKVPHAFGFTGTQAPGSAFPDAERRN